MHSSRPAEAEQVEETCESPILHLASQLRFWLVALIALALDLWSKNWVFANLSAHEFRTMIPDTIEFRRSLNDGAVFGSFTGYTSVFIIASLFALAFVFYLFANSHRTQRSLHIALALILAGAFGNLYDRAFVIADVAHYTNGSGRQETRIGLVISEPDAAVVKLGDYPDGKNVRRHAQSEISINRQGVVRDFIKFIPKFPSWVPKVAGKDMWPWVFNVADTALVCGVMVLLLQTWFDRKPPPKKE